MRRKSSALVWNLCQWLATCGASSGSISSKPALPAGPASQRDTCLTRPQRPPAQFERRNGIGKIRRRRAASDGRDLRLVVRKGARIGGSEMLGCDLFKRGHLAGGGPLPEKGVIGVFVRVHAGFSPKE